MLEMKYQLMIPVRYHLVAVALELVLELELSNLVATSAEIVEEQMAVNLAQQMAGQLEAVALGLLQLLVL